MIMLCIYKEWGILEHNIIIIAINVVNERPWVRHFIYMLLKVLGGGWRWRRGGISFVLYCESVSMKIEQHYHLGYTIENVQTQ